jgi:outer membrane protein TolC
MFRSAVFLLVLGLGGASASAQTTRTMLADVVAEALARNPEISAAQKRYEAARERPIQERSLPDPMVSPGYVANGRPWPGAGLGSEPTANIGVTVTQEVPGRGKRELRGQMAVRDADAEFQQIEAARLGITARVKQAYYRLAYADAASGVLTRNRDLLNTLLEVSEGRYAIGQAAQQDVIKAQTQLSIIELQLERVRQERASREDELNALMNRPLSTPIGVPEELELTDFDPSIDALVETARQHAPMLRREQLIVERSRLAVDLARSEYKPDYALSGGYAYMGSMPPMYEFRVDIRLPLQRARRAAAVAEQLHGVGAAELSYDSARLGLESRVQADFRMAATSRRLAALYRDTVLPQARLALESSMVSYQTGAVDFLSVLTNFGTLLEYELTYYEELSAFHTAVSRLEEMTGAPIAH